MSSPPASLETQKQKAALRAAALAARDALSSERRAAAAQAIARRGLPFEITPGTIVAGYSPIRSEIDPIPLMRKLAVPGVQLALPAIVAGDRPRRRKKSFPILCSFRWRRSTARATGSAMAPGIMTAPLSNYAN